MARAYEFGMTKSVEDFLWDKDIAILYEIETTMTRRVQKPREMYQPYQCKKCGKIPPDVVSTVGLPTLNLRSIRYDYFETEDGFPVVSSSLAELLEKTCGDAVNFLTIGRTQYHLLQCRDHVAPPRNSRLYKPLEPADPSDVFQVRGARCPKCGRFETVTYQPEAYPYPDDFSIFAFDIEQPDHLSLSICCSPAVARQIAAKKFKGLRLLPIP